MLYISTLQLPHYESSFKWHIKGLLQTAALFKNYNVQILSAGIGSLSGAASRPG